MKKLLIGIAAMTFTVSIGTTTAFAAENGWGRNFIDADNDGICDNCGLGMCAMGAGFVDADGDGICDHITAGMPRNGAGFHRGHFGGQGRWR